MADKTNNPDYNIIIDCIAEELDKIQEEASNRELYSIDLLALATDLFDSFETILSFGLVVHQIVLARTRIKDTATQKGIVITEENIDNILNSISQRLNTPIQNNSNEQ